MLISQLAASVQSTAILLGIVLISAYGGKAQAAVPGNTTEVPEMKLSSDSFKDGHSIPKHHTCDGLNISPSLTWSGVPAEAKSLTLIVDDPDAPDPAAPKMTWVHWLVYNIPPDAGGLMEGVEHDALPSGTLEGLNDWSRTGYGGPCPPVGRHRYFFKLYALDTLLPDLRHPTKTNLEKAMHGHILSEAHLVGLYQR